MRQFENVPRRVAPMAASESHQASIVCHGAGNPDKTKAEHWAAAINRKLSASVVSLIEAGAALKSAKSMLKHGEWQRMFAEKLVRIHLREAQRLMEIAGNAVLAKANNCSHLPTSVQALSALAKTDPVALQNAILAARVHPAMTIREAQGFQVENPTPGMVPKRVAVGQFDAKRSLRHCQRILRVELDKCPDEFRQTLINGIRELILRMEDGIRDSIPLRFSGDQPSKSLRPIRQRPQPRPVTTHDS